MKIGRVEFVLVRFVKRGKEGVRVEDLRGGGNVIVWFRISVLHK